MYRDDKQRMWQKNIIPTLENITRTFNENINYFSIITEKNRKSKTSLRELHFENGIEVFDDVIKTRFENLYWEEALANSDTRGDAMPGTTDASIVS